MSRDGEPLVVGAGPVGLAAALFLHHAGTNVRVIERRAGRSTQSRALAVNPRTLELLEPTGVTGRMLELGKHVTGARLHHKGRIAARVSFAASHGTYPFMLALSQATTERLLEGALHARGITVQRNTHLADIGLADGAAHVSLTHADGSAESLTPAWVLAADGSHSLTRERLQLGFDGSTLRSKWHLADASLDTEIEPDCAHVFLQPGGGFLFLIRVIDGDPDIDRRNLWRALGNRPNPLASLEGSTVVGEPVWASTFEVSHRIVRHFSKGNVHVAGDAAHVHSPVGARGMNLGIEDAWVFATLMQRGQIERYAALRREGDRGVVRRVSALSHIVATDPSPLRLVRSVLPIAAKLGPVRARIRRTIMGLDHPLKL